VDKAVPLIASKMRKNATFVQLKIVLTNQTQYAFRIAITLVYKTLLNAMFVSVITYPKKYANLQLDVH
jgi:hypothetical protein